MKIMRIYLTATFVVLLFGFSSGKSIEQDEEKTNEIKDIAAEANVTDDSEEVTELEIQQSTIGLTDGPTEAIESTEPTESQVTTEGVTSEAETTVPVTTVEPTTREPEQCNADPYCMAELLPAKIIINNTFIMCDQSIEPKDRCCLPNGPHLVCYNILVDGQYLNYDVAVAQLSTDITGLCKTIIKSQKEIQGQYTAASIEDGEGTQVYNYGKWSNLEADNNDSPQHIKDLACEILKKE